MNRALSEDEKEGEKRAGFTCMSGPGVEGFIYVCKYRDKIMLNTEIEKK